MKFKTILYIFICSFVLVNMTSCLGDDDDENFISKDSHLIYMSFSSREITALNSTSFSIDNVRNIIYNQDSLPYLTDIENKSVLLTYTTGSNSSNFEVTIDNEATFFKSGDSIAIDQINHINIYAINGDKKTYAFNLNIHKVDPDSIQYKLIDEDVDILAWGTNKTISTEDSYLTYIKKDNDLIYLFEWNNDFSEYTQQTLTGLPFNTIISNIQLANNGVFYSNTTDGALCSSTDGVNWSVMNFDYPVKAVLGSIDGFLCLIFEQGEYLSLGAYSENNISYGDKLPENFPTENFSIVNKNNSLYIYGGLTSVWATDNGKHWVSLDNPNQNYPDIKNGNAFTYDNKTYYIGGILPDGTYNSTIYTSLNGGLVWDTEGSNTKAPESFVLREGASVVTDNKYFYIIGGNNTLENPSRLTDIWQSGVNSKLFE
ncbi:hypothetical protein M2138_002011 [Dysgonomonadaceae bacterium PH5-43]|nr:hypothetical protein [Dysgonomonadaceae bacterium PH5-43]